MKFVLFSSDNICIATEPIATKVAAENLHKWLTTNQLNAIVIMESKKVNEIKPFNSFLTAFDKYRHITKQTSIASTIR